MSVFQRLLTRRAMLQTTVAGAAASLLPLNLACAEDGGESVPQGMGSAPGIPDQRYPFALTELPYASDALEAAIDARTMEIHHGRHHNGYVNKLNAALEGHTELHGRTLAQLVAGWDQIPGEVQAGVRNSGGGHVNHALFWPSMSPNGGGEAEGALARALADRFGSFQAFRDEFAAAAGSVFGSGWGWLAATDSGGLEVVTTPNQDNPISQGMIPLLGLDVWEHAYYLRYQNRRADYVQAFFDVVSWEEVGRRFDAL